MKATLAWKLSLLVAALALGVTAKAATNAPVAKASEKPAAKGGIIYVDDIDHWRAQLMGGAENAGGPLQGPALEVPGGSGMVFFPNGQAFAVGEGVIYQVQRNGPVRYLAGNPAMCGAQDGPVTRALLGRQLSACPDGKGGLFVGDRSNRTIRHLFPKDGQWQVETLAGDASKPEWSGAPVDGTGKAAIFRYLHSNVTADTNGLVYVMDQNFLRRMTPAGKVETLNSRGGSGAPAKEEEPLESARFNLIMGGAICFGGDGALYVADRWNHCVRRIDLQAARVQVVVGPGTGTRDGPDKEAGFHDSPGSIVYDPWRSRYYVNGVDDAVLRVWEKGEMRSIAGKDWNNKGFEGPARDTRVIWCNVTAVDPLPPHAIYFRSGGDPWKGRTGRLVKTDPAEKPAAAKEGGVP
jgi:hypothetical protein